MKSKGFRRIRFLAKTLLFSPAVVFVYSPLLVAQTIAGIAVPFATGRFIDTLVGGYSLVGSFVTLAALLLVRALFAPCLQQFILFRSRNIEPELPKRALESAMGFSPFELSPLANGNLVAKLTRDVYAVGRFVNGLYPRLVVAVVTMLAAGFALHSRSQVLGYSFIAFIPLTIVLFIPFARCFAATSHSVRQRSDSFPSYSVPSLR